MPHQSTGFQAAKSLKAVLVSRLQDRDAGSGTSEDLMKAVQLCDKYLTRANGTEAELEVLKSVVRQTLAKQATAKRRTASFSTAKTASTTLLQAQQQSESISKPRSPSSLASSKSGVSWPPLAGILVEPKAHVRCGDFDKMVIMQDDMAHKEETKAKQRVLTKQAATRTMLESQLADIAKDKAAAREAKRQEALELKKNIRQYEEEEVQKWQQHKEQQAKTKLMYSQQVADARQRHKAEKEAARHEQELERQQLAEEERRAAADKAARLEEEKTELARVMRENEAYLRHKAMAAQQAKEEEQRLNKEYAAAMERQEQKRLADAQEREAKSRRKYEVELDGVTQMAGGNALAEKLAESARLSEAKAAQVEAEHEAQQVATMQKKKHDQQKQQQLILTIRQQQMQERKQKQDCEKAAALQLAQQVNDDKRQYEEEVRAKKAAAKLEKKALLHELEQGYKDESKRRFNEQRGLVDNRDEWVHRAVLQGKANAFV